MILLAGCDLPPELDGQPWARLDKHTRPPGPCVVLAAGDGAREAGRLLPGLFAQVSAVLLVEPQIGGLSDAALRPWAPLVQDAARGRRLLAMWSTYQAPQQARRRHPYDAAWIFGQWAEQSGPGLDLELDPGALLAWPAGEVLCSPRGGAWSGPPQVGIKIAGAFVAVVDQVSPSDELGLLIGPSALARAVLPAWDRVRPPLPRTTATPSPPAAPKRRNIGQQASEAGADLDELLDGAERLGLAVGRGTRLIGQAASAARGLWRKVRA